MTMQLLTPLQVGPIAVKNRMVTAAHGAFLDFYAPESNGQRFIDYTERRAKGGVGLMIMNAVHVHETSRMGPQHQVFDAATMPPKFRKLAAAAHDHGAKIVQQLYHVGAVATSDNHRDMEPLWGFSDAVTATGERVHVMDDAEIELIIDAFVDAAKCAVDNDLDGIELHATHGYLIQQSMEPYANRRTDRWGEPLAFLRELGTRTRRAIGSDKALGLRVTLDDFLPPERGGLGVEGLEDLAVQIVDLALFDYLNTSEGRGGVDYHRAIGNYRHKFGEFLPETKSLRERIDARLPVIAATKIPTVDLAERALEEGACDLVSMVRGHIADPDIIAKLMAGEESRIRPCTGSNQGCIDRAGSGAIACFHNPEVGQERRFAESAAETVEPKKVLVVGGGPAGMKAAEIAATRGHRVTLVEQAPALGGRLRLVEQLGDASNLFSAVVWVEQELVRLGVEVLTQTVADAAFVRAHAPDEIVLATGAQTIDAIDVPNDESVLILSSDDAASGSYQGQRFDIRGSHVVLFDQRANYETALVLDSLVRQAARVTVVTPFLHFGANLGFTHQCDYRRLLPEWGVTVRAQTGLVGIADGAAVLHDGLTGTRVSEPCDLIVAGIAPMPRLDELDAFRAIAPVRLAGDVVAPRTAMHAFREGDRAGRTL